MKLVGGGFKFGLVATSLILSHAALGQIHQAAFENINSSVFKTHIPLIERQFSASLIILELWQNYGGAFKVDSARKPAKNEFIITLTGDIPQNQFMEQDGYAIVACHEMGHILGESPKQTKGLSKWSSVEGQADYYATSECMWRYISDVKANDNIKANSEILSLCETAYSDDLSKILGCVRIISGIMAMQNYFNDTSSKEEPVDYRRKDPTIVDITLEKYPSNQCRIDTMMAGVLKLARPSCWFAEGAF